MRNFFKKAKLAIIDNKKIVNLAFSTTKNIINLSKDSTTSDYINFSLSLGKDLIDNLLDSEGTIDTKIWKNISSPTLICLLKNNNFWENTKIVTLNKYITRDLLEIKLCIIDKVEFLITFCQNYVQSIYIKINQESLYKNIIYKYILDKNKLIISFANSKNSYDLKFSQIDNNSILTDKTKSLSSEILNYNSNNYNRSLLLIGPPGSGKTNLAQSITKFLNLRTLIFEKISNINLDNIIDIFDIINPQAIIIDDIDHLTIDRNEFLSKLEYLNKQNILILGTANTLLKLDSALIRPGRFDEIIEINKLEKEIVMKMVDNDLELFELVKDFPAAYINEVIKRIKIKGKKETIKTLDDLKFRIKEINTKEYSFDQKP